MRIIEETETEIYIQVTKQETSGYGLPYFTNGKKVYASFSREEVGCICCELLTETFLQKHPNKKGQVFCEKCMKIAGIVPMESTYDAEIGETKSKNSTIYL